MTSDPFDQIFARLSSGLAGLSDTATGDTSAAVGVTSVVTSADGTITVAVCDGRVLSIEVVDRRIDPHLWPALIAAINDGLAVNQVELVAELRRRSPSLDTLQRLSEETSTDLKAAFSSTLRDLP